MTDSIEAMNDRLTAEQVARQYPPRGGAAFVEWAADRFDVDVDAMARIVADHLRFIIADPQMCNPRTHELTGEGADWLYEQLRELYQAIDEMEKEVGHPSFELAELLTAQQIAGLAEDLDEWRDEKLRAALEAGSRVRDICRVTGFSRSRVYQIRDNRR